MTAALLLLEHWWSRTGIRMSAMDPPGRLPAAAVATLPDHRREWGMPLTYALWPHEALRLYAINGGLLWFGDGAPEGGNLGAALFWALRFAPCSDSHSP